MQQHRFTGARRRDDQSTLSLAERSHQVDNARGQIVGTRLEADALVTSRVEQQDGKPFVYRLVVKKDPDYWFFVAQDMTSTAEVRARIKLILIAAVVLFTVLAGFIGWWSASRVMRPVSELANLLSSSDESARPAARATLLM